MVLFPFVEKNAQRKGVGSAAGPDLDLLLSASFRSIHGSRGAYTKSACWVKGLGGCGRSGVWQLDRGYRVPPQSIHVVFVPWYLEGTGFQ
jgi:hypothetical protein